MKFTDPGSGPNGPASAGLEACAYDHGTASFLVNNDGSTANPHGETDVIPATFVLTGTPANPVTLTLPVPAAGNGFKIYPLGNCDPTGIDLGPGTDFGVMCRQGTTGALLTFQILDRTNGTVRAVLNAGGGDQIVYECNESLLPRRQPLYGYGVRGRRWRLQCDGTLHTAAGSGRRQFV